MDDLVIGSGPAGVSAATALLARGRRVTMLDGGKLPEDDAEARLAGLARLEPSDWRADQRATWQEPQFHAPAGQVRRFGSDFAMEPAPATFAEAPEGVALRASRAAGGLSNLWGAAVLPYRQADIADWPVSADDLAPHYRAVAGFMPVAGRHDDLEALFPAFGLAGHAAIAPSPQAAALLARLAALRDPLAARGVTAGAARQAVDAGCRLCGLCLHGCPYRLIWSARDRLDRLRADPGFTYRPGAVVRQIAETGDGVTLTLADGTTIGGARAFLGAGVLETARILLASDPGSGELTMKDSQHAFVPLIQRWRNPVRPDHGRFHTLPQVFVEIDSPAVSPRLVHAQIYTWNEYYARDLIANYGRGLAFARPLLTALARRLIVAQVFLHSDHSARIGLRLAADGRLLARPQANPDTGRVLKAATGHLAAALGPAGLTALRLASRPGAAGSSFHAGATVPMAQETRPGTSDRLGRPHGLGRVHLVDASVLPAIPATTITFSVMANAHRIAALAP